MSNEIKSTTMLYKRLNFSVSTLKKLGKSLKHSLRVHSKEEKKIQWDEDLSNKNIFIVNGKPVPMNEASALSFIKDTLTPFHLVNRSKEQRKEDVETKGKYKYKIKKIIKDEAGQPIAAYLDNLIDRGDYIDGEQVKEDFEAFEVSRKAQKLKSVQNYIDLHNTITQAEKPLDGRKTVIQEAFFKFPMHNQVDLPAEFYVSAIQDFYAKYFPDYNVLLTVYHGDELEGGKKKVGDHPHIFIDCKNKRTGEYDLTEQQAVLANKVIKHLEFFKSYTPVNTKQQTYQESQIIGEALQELFYKHINKKFKTENISLVANRLEQTQENLELRKKIRLESKKTKENRAFNLYTMRQEQLEEIENKLMEVAEEVENKKQIKGTIDQEIHQGQQVSFNLQMKIEKAETYWGKRLAQFDSKLKENTTTLSTLTQKRIYIQQDITQLQNKKVELRKNFKTEKDKLQKKLNDLKGKVTAESTKHKRIKQAIMILDEKLEPLIHKFDVKVDKVLHANRMHENTETLYQEMKENILQTAKYMGKEKRHDYLWSVKEQLEEKGLDPDMVNFGFKEKVQLFISDTFTSTQIIDFDKQEAVDAKAARAKRSLYKNK
ncbi:hypothetical protein [Pseudomonas sp. MF7451]|uniref:hypothetical protein n=1 Tax=Pseudomonas sp. MF7451 TaxID=2797538 RepID=UPI0018E8B3B2|nr:hypothetical protein [Pseudomonas sp. MF7451]MBJ2223393.1 hypothetical protein [Pseudomonas sp. MF7451]MBK3433561.1 hypothetical protein [Pseudomonas fluorescens]